jgi:3',5'-nucleoside bisphosphate phosphatase
MSLSTTGLHLAAGASIDLHLHTLLSDGEWTPEGLFEHLVNQQFDLVAITDHDRPDTAGAMQQLAQAKSLPVLVGVEMSAMWRGQMTDLLCFGFDPAHSALHELAQEVWRQQQDKTRRAFETLQSQGYPLPPAALDDLLAQPNTQQPHALAAFLKSHAVPSSAMLAVKECFTFAANDLADVVDAAHRSGAVCLIAHPGHGDYMLDYDLELLDQARREAPLDGLEVFHPKHTPAKTELYLEYAHKHHLLISAGSDSHRPDKLPVKYRAELCRALLERLGIPLK